MIPLIPPLFVGNQLVTDFLVTTNLVYVYFSQQCATIDKNNTIPENITFETEERLSVCSNDIVKIIMSLTPNRLMNTIKYLSA